jgi:hypothetical protein
VGRIFTDLIRYSCRHSHSCTFHKTSRLCFTRCGTLPYHSRLSAEFSASVRRLSPVEFSAPNPDRPVSCYAFFQGWLLLSQPPGCLWDPTSFHTERQFRDLSLRSGLFPFCHMQLSPHGLSLLEHLPSIRGLVGSNSFELDAIQSPTPGSYQEAIPEYLSGRTSYLRVRLAFYPYPQIITYHCTGIVFGPPSDFRRSSPCPGIDHSVSGLLWATYRLISDSLSLRLLRLKRINLAAQSNSSAHSSIGTPSPR